MVSWLYVKWHALSSGVSFFWPLLAPSVGWLMPARFVIFYFYFYKIKSTWKQLKTPIWTEYNHYSDKRISTINPKSVVCWDDDGNTAVKSQLFCFQRIMIKHSWFLTAFSCSCLLLPPPQLLLLLPPATATAAMVRTGPDEVHISSAKCYWRLRGRWIELLQVGNKETSLSSNMWKKLTRGIFSNHGPCFWPVPLPGITGALLPVVQDPNGWSPCTHCCHVWIRRGHLWCLWHDCSRHSNSRLGCTGPLDRMNGPRGGSIRPQWFQPHNHDSPRMEPMGAIEILLDHHATQLSPA